MESWQDFVFLWMSKCLPSLILLKNWRNSNKFVWVVLNWWCIRSNHLRKENSLFINLSEKYSWLKPVLLHRQSSFLGQFDSNYYLRHLIYHRVQQKEDMFVQQMMSHILSTFYNSIIMCCTWKKLMELFFCSDKWVNSSF